MNVYDTERMTDALEPMGYEQAGSIEAADLIILNTCHIREKAAEKVYSELGRIKQIKQRRARDGKPTIIGVAGCVAQAEGEEMIARAPVVDLVFGPQTYHRLADMIGRVEADAGGSCGHGVSCRGQVHLDISASRLRRGSSRAGHTAFVTVQEGCDKFCTFCVVPIPGVRSFPGPSSASATRSAVSPPPASGKSPCSARTSTPIMAKGRTVSRGRSAA